MTEIDLNVDRPDRLASDRRDDAYPAATPGLRPNRRFRHLQVVQRVIGLTVATSGAVTLSACVVTWFERHRGAERVDGGGEQRQGCADRGFEAHVCVESV